ncbi:MAG: hypothetical protein ACOY0R_10570 [Chloroflexota bacterium]|jgi:hypothetical protein
METLQLEVMAEERRRELICTMRGIRLEREAERSSHRTGWFARGMIFVGARMVAWGGQLQRRYAEAQPVRRSFSMSQR